MYNDLRSAILYAGDRYGLSRSELLSLAKDVHGVLVGPLGNFLDEWWPRNEALPDPGFVTRFDTIVPWLVREASYGRGPRAGFAGADMQLDVSKVAGWVNSLDASREALLDAMDQETWLQALALGRRWYCDFTDGLIPGVPVSMAAILARWPDGGTIQRLTRAIDFDSEGLSMNHCLRQILHYYDDVMNGHCVLMSYRDPEGVPRVTWELNIDRGPPRIVQLQGPANGPIHDPDARDRLAWFLSSHLGLSANDNLSGMWAERIGLERRRPARAWSSRYSSSSMPVSTIPYPSSWRVEEVWSDLEESGAEGWETNLLSDELIDVEDSLEDAVVDLDISVERGASFEKINELLKLAVVDTARWIDVCEELGLIGGSWEAPEVIEPAWEAWEILDNLNNVWSLEMIWEPDRALLSWSAQVVSSPGDTSSFRAQHMGSPREALEAAGLEIPVEDLIDGRRWALDRDDPVSVDRRDIFEIEPMKEPTHDPEQTALIPIGIPASGPAMVELPGDRDRMMEDLIRILDDEARVLHGGDDGGDFDPNAALARGGRGAVAVRTAEECVLPHEAFARSFPLQG